MHLILQIFHYVQKLSQADWKDEMHKNGAALLDGLPVLENLCMGSPYVLLEFCLKHPREVEMRLVSGTTSDLHFMKLLLATSPILEIMVVKQHPATISDEGLRILKELLQFQHLSPKAKITYTMV
ncbi:hypothetical protein RHMOL_Rhmol12G0073300 [Rhododendron molle]|uniref:Uncharacterized protein n=1 Tax=Rhododendron molle TaxID=49168 RepID=A0ACC0LFP8_RHOML|nr:hypothetical protein RHMOL_Rhmol12G0073300 [Rhododendron molle]